MISVSLSEIANVCEGQLVGEDLVIERVVSDTRKDAKEALFIALKGHNFDAHEFLSDAAEQGARALLTEHRSVLALPQVIVKDSRLALGHLGHLVRNKSKARFVGLTGSVGKTSVKEMIAKVLCSEAPTLATEGNFNNEIGVPITLLRLQGKEEFVVIEMGANHVGEILYTSHIVSPDVALITNVAAAHLEGFGDLQGVARAKGEIFSGLSENGIAVLNRDDVFYEFWKNRITQKSISFGVDESADVRAANIDTSDSQCLYFDVIIDKSYYPVRLRVPGLHNVSNALAAISVGLALNLPIDNIIQSLSSYTGVKGRLQIHQPNKNLTVIDDSYNANYASLKAAIDVLKTCDGMKILALGDMGELGKDAREYHQKAGDYAKQAGIDWLLTFGVLSQFAQHAFGENGKHFSSHEKLTEFLKQQLKTIKSAVLLKGSRSAHMERVVEPLLAWAENQSGGTQ